MRFLWDQLAASKPVIRFVSDAKLVSAHRERLRLHQFLMGILDDFESVRSQLLNRSPLPTVNQAVNDLVREETRLKSHRSSQPHTTVLATPVSVDPTITAPPRALTASESVPSSDAASFDPVSLTTPTYSIADLQALFSQVQPSSSSASNPALSVTPGISSEWFLDSACCNHMTDNPHLTSAHTPPVLPTITTADRLRHDCLNLFFSSRGCLVQDFQMGQIVGTRRKVGQLFELTSLHFPSFISLRTRCCCFCLHRVVALSSRSCFLPRIKTLVSRGLLGSVSSSPFDCMSCQLGKQPILPFNSESIASTTFDLIHSDVWGPSPVPTDDPLPDLFPKIHSTSAESVNLISDESPPVDPTSDESPTVDPTFDESPLSTLAANPVNTTASKPRRSHRASSDPLWQQTMKEVLDALLKTGTWDLVDFPASKSTIGCKWVYKIKTRSDGTVDRYNACLVAKGFTQEYGIDYDETFALMDVKNVFLNGELTEEVYMQLPLGFSHPPGFSHKVCRLRRGIQDLKRFLGYYLTQAKYTSDLISRVGITDNKIVDTPIEYNNRLNTHGGEPLLDATLYRQLVGSVVYLTVTQPDISYSVHIVS
uniref:Reverse transcriptase Ty1/copia-type domain-containing protein n=1 Tax=Fagus sylvatica TaxID=28930 RepID=A0A2N9FVK1_FAGSY